MRPFSPRMFPHRVTVHALVETNGPSSGVAESFPLVAGPLPCRVRWSSNREGFAAAGESSVTVGQVAFPADPGVSKGYQFVYGARKLRAIGPAQPRDAAGVLFVVDIAAID